MCGIVAAAAKKNIVPVLIEGLKKLEYRGYDSAGLADIGNVNGRIERVRSVGRMAEHYGLLSPVLHVVSLHLLSYHVALVKGTDVDKPRNLAKCVTVE